MGRWTYPHPAHGSCLPGCSLYGSGACHCLCGGRTKRAVASEPKMGRRLGEYNAFLAGHRKALGFDRRVGAWLRNGVPIERIRPMARWIVRTYGRKNGAGAAGIPEGTLANMATASRTRVASRPVAEKIVRFVLAHRRSQDPHRWLSDAPRLPTPQDQVEAQRVRQTQSKLGRMEAGRTGGQNRWAS